MVEPVTGIQAGAAGAKESAGPREPIAITGIGCRFPGARGPQAFWKLLRDGVDAIAEVPASRFDVDAVYDPRPGIPGKLNTRWGGFIDGVDLFDPYFFGIAPREAAGMDPQHRILLEVTWEALEDAGEVPARLASAPVGVFVGQCTNDYGNLIADPAAIDIYYAAGNARSVLSGRLSHALGLQGPSVVIDTACSSSLVAVHLACQSLWSGESHLAVAAGVNLVLLAATSIGFTQAQMLAPDGRCKAFDARADGFVRSDGVAAVILKPLSRALAANDPIYAVIRGVAVNNDGNSGGLLMTPSQAGQEAVLRQAYRHAGLSPADVQYVETHGTGTSAGDPVEAQALGAVLAAHRAPDAPCIIGSVKTNIGHTEAAAGLAGLIKVALALRHRAIPPSLHFRDPNPGIPWKDLPLTVGHTLTPWPDASPARAGVSSFGISGTNAHAVLEEVPSRRAPVDRSRQDPRPAQLLALSAHSPEALEAGAREYQAFLGGAEPPALESICYTASRRRSHHDYRLALVARSPHELAGHLGAFLQGESRPGMSSGRSLHGRRRKLVFVFSGQGSQWAGMGRDLAAREPVFREALRACAQAIERYVDWSVLDELGADESRSRLHELDVVQPMLFAVQVALAALWRAWGVEPDAVVGHSMGEIAAAHVSGILDLDDAARIVCRRSQVVRRRASGQGGMAVVELPVDAVRELLAGHGDRLAIAGCNSPTTTVVAGEPAALYALGALVERRGDFFQRVKVDYASHSPQMEALRPELLEVLGTIRARPASVPMLSTVSGSILAGPECDASYWVANIREPVLFAQAIDDLAGRGHDAYLEVSAHPVISQAVSQCLQRHRRSALVLSSLRRNEDGGAALLGALGALYADGAWHAFERLYPEPGRCVPLPFYPWQRERFWLDPAVSDPGREGARPTKGHPLLGRRLSAAAQPGAHFWEVDVGVRQVPYLAEHRVQGQIVFPAAAYLEMALAAAARALGPGRAVLDEVRFTKALFLPEAGHVTVQLGLSPGMVGETLFQVFSREAGGPDSPGSWTLHASGAIRVESATTAPVPAHEAPERVRERCAEAVTGSELYERVQEYGLQYGGAFQGVEEIWRRDGEAVGRLSRRDSLEPAGSSYRVHPTLLDSCFQVLAAALTKGDAGSATHIYLPVAVETLRLYGKPGSTVWSHVRLRPADESAAGSRVGDVFLVDADGTLILEVLGFRLQRVGDAAKADPDLSTWLYELQWQPKPRDRKEPARRAEAARPGSLLVFTDAGTVGPALEEIVGAAGRRTVLVSPADAYRRLDPAHYEVNAVDPADFRRLLADVGAAEGTCAEIVHLWSLRASSPTDTTLDSLQAAKALGCFSVLHLVQALAELRRSALPGLWLVTAGAQPAGEKIDQLSVAQSPLWGLGKVIAIEHPELRTRIVDLSARATAEEVRFLAEELAAPDQEDQIAIRGAARYAARVVRYSREGRPEPKRPLAPGESFKLDMPTPGILDGLVFRPAPRRAPGRGQVGVQVAAVGLNFRDVLIAMGLVPTVLEGAMDLGWECAGRISAIGEGVDGLHPGQEVIANAPGCLADFAITDARLVVPKPPQLTFEEAATIPTAFITAYYALHRVGKLRRGERILIHAAAGGVGLAAVQMAQRIGALVFATAGSPEKRDYLRSLGVEHVMDSRSLDFADEVVRITDGAGVDVVLNSLAGEFISKGLSTLAPGGRFLEIGKIDILKNTPLGLRQLANNVAFIVIDLAGPILKQPEFFPTLFRETMRYIDDAKLSPLPHRDFPMSEVADAFRYMAQAKHIGKVVVTAADETPLVAPAPGARATFRADATYLVTGGLGGLGLVVARWMVERGARHLVLMGRRGAASANAQETLKALAEAGAAVTVARADVADREQVARTLDELRASHPPLRGVIHAAVALDDGVLLTLDRRRFETALAAKIDGTWNLHSLTLGVPLDFFVLFSTGASVLGAPGLGNYVTGSAFVDALAHHRRALGLPATTINWGAWSEVGLAAKPDAKWAWKDQGLAYFTPAHGLALLERILADDPAQVMAVTVDWANLLTAYSSPLLAELAAEVATRSGPVASKRKVAALGRERLQAADPGDRQRLVETFLVEQIARVLKCAPSKIDVHQRINRLGIDSLMAVELKNRVEGDLDAPLPVALLLRGPTLAELSAHLLEQLGLGPGAAAEGPRASQDAPKERPAPRGAADNGQPDNGRPHPPPADTVDEEIDLGAEVVLDRAVVPETLGAAATAAPAAIFLTGATGFLGAFLLAGLLRRTGADIHCLVRAADPDEGRRRISGCLEAYGVWDPSWSARVHPVPGELSRPLLGMPAATFEQLARRTDAIYHCAAMVNFVYPYSAHKASNVLGTVEVLRLAAMTRTKPVHYVSTLGVFPAGRDWSGVTAGEDDPLAYGEKMRGGYAQSKWVAERIVSLAGARGLPVCIYRPGYITGHSATGAWSTVDVASSLLRCCIALGSAPDMDIRVDMTPVDYVSDAIVQLSGQIGSIGKTFHLCNPAPLRVGQLLAGIRAAGYAIRSIPYAQWREDLRALVHASGDGADHLVLARSVETLREEHLCMPEFDCANTLAGIEGTSIVCPPADGRLLDVYLGAFARRGWLGAATPGPAARDGG